MAAKDGFPFHRPAALTFARFRPVPTLTIELVATVATHAWARAITASVALAIGVLVLAAGRKAIQQTTLVSAWWWSLTALASWGAVEIYFAAWPASGSGASGSAIRLAVLSLGLCPAVGLNDTIGNMDT